MKPGHIVCVEGVGCVVIAAPAETVIVTGSVTLQPAALVTTTEYVVSAVILLATGLAIVVLDKPALGDQA